MNKSAFLKLSLLKKTSSKCIHTKNVYGLIDLPKIDDFSMKITQHIQGCQVCHDEFENYKQKQFAIRVLIPKPFIDNETKEIFENEVSEMFKSFNLNEADFQKKQLKEKIRTLDSVGSNIIKHLTSPKNLFIYGLGISFYFILKKFN